MAFLSRPSPYRRSLSAGPRTPLTVSVYLPARHLRGSAVSPGPCVPVRVPRMPAMCREPLCPSGALPLRGRRFPPPRKALPLRRRSYGLMSRTKSLPPPSALASSEGLRRLLPAPAARWSFPALSPQSLYRCLGPYPGSPLWCLYPFLPREHRPHLRVDRFGAFRIPPPCNFYDVPFSGLQPFRYVQAPILARPPGCTYRSGDPRPRAAGPFTPRNGPTVTRRNCGIATCLNRAIGTAGLSPAGLRPCRPLPDSFGKSLCESNSCAIIEAVYE